MSAELWLYLISVLGNANVFLFGLSLLSFILHGVFANDADYIPYHFSDEERRLKRARLMKEVNKWKCIFYITIVLLIIIPSQKTMYAMLTTNVMKQSDIPERVLNILDTKLSEYEGKHDK